MRIRWEYENIRIWELLRIGENTRRVWEASKNTSKNKVIRWEYKGNMRIRWEYKENRRIQWTYGNIRISR